MLSDDVSTDGAGMGTLEASRPLPQRTTPADLEVCLASTSQRPGYSFGRELGGMPDFPQVVVRRYFRHLKTYAKTQATVAKSSGESELYGVVRASTDGLGILTLLADFGATDYQASVGMDASAAIGIVQRSGLGKLRHVEVDVLWLQEQQARRLLPIRKVPGTANPADMGTKNLAVALMDKYLDQLNLEVKEGRAEVAQQLHDVHVGRKPTGLSPVCASPPVGVSLGGVIGGRMISEVSGGTRACASPVDGGLLTGVVGGPGSSGLNGKIVELQGGAKMKKIPDTKTAEERKVDSWESSGKDGKWKRSHRTPRRCLFTPHKVIGGPDRGARLKRFRVTKGTDILTQKAFKIVDDYTQASNAHRMIGRSWTGTTEFHEVAEFIEVSGDDTNELDEKNDKDNKKIKWADMESDEEGIFIDKDERRKDEQGLFPKQIGRGIGGLGSITYAREVNLRTAGCPVIPVSADRANRAAFRGRVRASHRRLSHYAVQPILRSTPISGFERGGVFGWTGHIDMYTLFCCSLSDRLIDGNGLQTDRHIASTRTAAQGDSYCENGAHCYPPERPRSRLLTLILNVHGSAAIGVKPASKQNQRLIARGSQT